MEIKQFQYEITNLMIDDYSEGTISGNLIIALDYDGTLKCIYNGEAIECADPDWGVSLEKIVLKIGDLRRK